MDNAKGLTFSEMESLARLHQMIIRIEIAYAWSDRPQNVTVSLFCQCGMEQRIFDNVSFAIDSAMEIHRMAVISSQMRKVTEDGTKA